MIKGELNNPNITEADRRKLMGSLSNMINTINNINKTTPEEFYDPKPDLNLAFVEVQKLPPNAVKTRRHTKNENKKPILVK